MRTLRLSLVGMLTVVLLGGLGGAVLAQDEEALASDEPHPVSGTCAFAGESGAESYGEGDGRWWRHGYPIRQSCEMDDARLSGNLRMLWNHESIGGPIYRGDGEVIAGTVQLVNDDGSWVGTVRGHVAYEEFGRHHYWQFELTGTGPYEGYSALAYAEGAGGGGPKKVEGFVFPGALPEYPDPVDVPAE